MRQPLVLTHTHPPTPASSGSPSTLSHPFPPPTEIATGREGKAEEESQADEGGSITFHWGGIFCCAPPPPPLRKGCTSEYSISAATIHQAIHRHRRLMIFAPCLPLTLFLAKSPHLRPRRAPSLLCPAHPRSILLPDDYRGGCRPSARLFASSCACDPAVLRPTPSPHRYWTTVARPSVARTGRTRTRTRTRLGAVLATCDRSGWVRCRVIESSIPFLLRLNPQFRRIHITRQTTAAF